MLLQGYNEIRSKKSIEGFPKKKVITMTNTSCYNVEGIQVCPPVDAKKYGDYALIGLAVLAAALILGAVTINNASIIGTELLNGSTYYLGY